MNAATVEERLNEAMRQLTLIIAACNVSDPAACALSTADLLDGIMGAAVDARHALASIKTAPPKLLAWEPKGGAR